MVADSAPRPAPDGGSSTPKPAAERHLQGWLFAPPRLSDDHFVPPVEGRADLRQHAATIVKPSLVTGSVHRELFVVIEPGPSGDTRPFTRQARNVVGLTPLVMGILGAVTNPGLFTFWTGLALSGAVVTCQYALSLRFEARHLDETRDFWRDHEATMRPRVFVANAVGFIVTGASLAKAISLGDFQAAGFFLPVALLSGSCVLLMWGKVP